MSELAVRTNNQYRNLLSWHELTPKEQKEFDYLDTEDKQDWATFFRYKGQVYDLGEFMLIKHDWGCLPNGFNNWHGYQSDSFFSGILIKYSGDCEQVLVGSYFC